MIISKLRMRMRMRMLAGATVSCLALADGSDASAQTDPQVAQAEAAGKELGEVVVTARRVAENLQDVPVAVTAISGEGLRRQNALNLTDLARIAPGLVLPQSRASGTAINLQLRGQYQNDVVATLDPSVGTYVDGLYWARGQGLNADLLDVQSAQVLRGPQGTLFGRNTTGGALLIQTNDPDPGRFDGLVSAGYGRFDERTGTAVVNVPVVADKVALRLAGSLLKRDGYIDSTPYSFGGVDLPRPIPLSGDVLAGPQLRGGLGRKVQARDNWTVRGKLLLRPTDRLDVVLSAERYRFDALTPGWRLAVVDPTSVANTEAGLELGASPAVAAAAGRAFFANYIPYAQQGDPTSLNEDSRSYAKTQTYVGTATLDTGFGAVKFVGGYRKVLGFNTQDLDGSPIYLISSTTQQDLKQYSGELQFTGKAFDDALDFAFGAFYFKEYGTELGASNSLPMVAMLPAAGTTAPRPLTTNLSSARIDAKSQGLYGQGAWHFDDAWSVTAGLRYSVDDKGVAVFNRTVLASTLAPLACSIVGAPLTSSPEPCRQERSDDFDGVSYTLGLNYQVDPDMLLYVKTSKGFRSGGQNSRASGVAQAAFVPFKPEITYEHEFGLKTEQFDRRLRLNVAAFANTVNDIQRSTLVTFINPTTNTAGSTTIVGNAGKVRTYGGEAELTAILFEGFTLTSNAAYVKPKYKEFFGLNAAGQRIDRRDERFEQVPRWTASLAASYQTDVAFGALALNASYVWQDETPINAVNYFVDAAGVTRDVTSQGVVTAASAQAILAQTTQKAGGQLNLRAAVTFLHNSLEVAAWGRNVLDFRPNAIAALPLGILAIQRRDPAMYGATVTYRFGQ